MPFFSPSTGGFYTKEIHGQNIPQDAVEVSARKHAKLMLAQSEGHEIVATRSGVTSRPLMPSGELAMTRAIHRTKRVARRKILAVASLERQSNDNATLALGTHGEPGFDAALERRNAINAIRAASNAIEGYLNGLAPDALASFNPDHCSLWP